MLWKKLDDEYFVGDKDARRKRILMDRARIVAWLNEDYQKVFFPRKLDGGVCDLGDMTYQEVALRMAELMYVTARQDQQALDCAPKEAKPRLHEVSRSRLAKIDR